MAKDSDLGKLGLSAEKFKLDGGAGSIAAIEKLKPLLKGKIVGVQAATTNLEFLKEYFADTVEIREYKTTEQHDLDLSAGRIDALFCLSRQHSLQRLQRPNFSGFHPGRSGLRRRCPSALAQGPGCARRTPS